MEKQSSCARYDLAPLHSLFCCEKKEQTSKFSDCFLLHVGGGDFPRQFAQSSRGAHVALEAREGRREAARDSRLGKERPGEPSDLMQAFFSDSCKSPAYRISSVPVASKPRRGAAALSSLLPLTGRFITPEICTDQSSVRRTVSTTKKPPGSSSPGGSGWKRFTRLTPSLPALTLPS